MYKPNESAPQQNIELSKKEILLKIQKSIDVEQSLPIKSNCAGFVFFILGNNSVEKRIDMLNGEIDDLLKQCSETDNSNTFDISKAKKAKFIAIRYDIQYPNQEIIHRFSHFALIDPENNSYLFQRGSGGAKIQRVSSNKISEFMVPLRVGGGMLVEPKIIYYKPKFGIKD